MRASDGKGKSMLRLHLTRIFLGVVLIALYCGAAGAAVLGDPNVVVNGLVTINASFPSFTPKLDIYYPTALAGAAPIRMSVGHPAARFLMQAYGSGRTDNLKNSGVLSSNGERLMIGGEGGTSVMFFANNQFVAGNGHIFIQGTPGATMGYVGIGTKTPTTRLDVAGEVKMTVANITGGSDLSEKFEVKVPAGAGAQPAPGMVVCIDPENPGKLVLSTKLYDRTVAGIISGAGGLKTGMTMGQENSLADGAHAVALTGRVYCHVDATEHGVLPGDLLTTSSTAGHATKVVDHEQAAGAILGKAMTPMAQGTKGLVMVLVSLQ